MKKPALVLLSLVVLASCATPSREADQRARLISQMLTSTVQLIGVRAPDTHRAGSGVVLGPAGDPTHTLILTTKHLLTPVGEHTLLVMDPLRRKEVPAKVIAVSSEADLALLEVSGLTLTPVMLKANAQLGDPVWVVAFPWGRRRTIVSGVVSQITWEEKEPRNVPIHGPVRLIDAPVSYGASGGGVFDAKDGRLLGVVRGYRSAELSLPGTEAKAVKIPIAGETTVVATPEIRRFLRTLGLERLLPPVHAPPESNP